MSSFQTTMWAPLSQSLANGAPPFVTQRDKPITMVSSNPRDGAVIFTTPDEIAARSDGGDVLAFYPRTLDYSFQHGNDLLGDFANGSIAVSNASALVVVDRSTRVSVHFPNGTSENFGRLNDPQSGAYERLVASGVIDIDGIKMLMNLERRHHDLSKLEQVRDDYDKSTDAMFENLQRHDIMQNYAPLIQP